MTWTKPEKIEERSHVEGARVGYLKKDRQERYNLKRGWFVDAWRIVDPLGRDLVQPWMSTKKEAIRTAGELGITLVIVSKPLTDEGRYPSEE